jgi:hypothetical protein
VTVRDANLERNVDRKDSKPHFAEDQQHQRRDAACDQAAQRNSATAYWRTQPRRVTSS